MKGKTEIVAVVPVREGSQRVKNKNFRPFAQEKSILHLKLRHLKEENCFDHIYVSSDSQKASEIARECGCEFLKRDRAMCSNDVRWSEAVDYILSTIPGEPIVGWALTTSPLHARYKELVDTFLKNIDTYDSLLTVRRFQEFLVKKNGRPFNYSPGPWHEYSQDLEPLYQVTGAFYIARKTDMVNWHYWFGIKPYLFEVSYFESLDIDTEEQFRLAECIYTLESRGALKVGAHPI